MIGLLFKFPSAAHYENVEIIIKIILYCVDAWFRFLFVLFCSCYADIFPISQTVFMVCYTVGFYNRALIHNHSSSNGSKSSWSTMLSQKKNVPKIKKPMMWQNQFDQTESVFNTNCTFTSNLGVNVQVNYFFPLVISFWGTINDLLYSKIL